MSNTKIIKYFHFTNDFNQQETELLTNNRKFQKGVSLPG